MGYTAVSNLLQTYIEALYDVLSPEEMFPRAKVYSWQTFFHHSTSVALISYRLGELIKKNLQLSVDKLAISSLERSLGISYESLLFYTGFAHDYAKLYGVQGKTGESRIRDLLSRLMKADPAVAGGADVESLIEKIVRLAMAVEGKYEPNLEESLVKYVAPVVSVADQLMGSRSLDDATRLLVSDEFRRLTEDYGLRFGYVMVSTPSVLYAKISKKIVDILRSYGWIPLALYADGLVVAGDADSKPVPLSEIEGAIEQEVLTAFETRQRIEDLATKLGNKALAELFGYLEQTKASEKLEVGDDPVVAYHNLIVTYLSTRDPEAVARELKELRAKLKKKGNLIDPRTLATGIGKGSTYFDTLLSTMITSPNELAEILVSIKDKQKRFLLLSFIMAFASGDVGVVKGVLTELGVAVHEEDAELIRIIAISEAYSRMDRDEEMKSIVKAVVGRLRLFDVKPYIARSLAKIRGNIVDVEGAKISDALKGRYKSYCRICGEPVEPMIKYIEYSRVLKKVGGASEIWLHDDPPLADLEKISGEFRHICPMCYYESYLVNKGYRPPFLVLALHPVVSYDLWEYVVRNIAELSNIWNLLQRKPQDIARNYEELATSMKLNEKIRRWIRESLGEEETGVTPVIDSLGARILLPLGKAISVKKRESAIALALAPIAMIVAGGGQVGLVGTISDAQNLGVEPYPVMLPLPSPLVEDVVATFERIKVNRARHGKDLGPEDYAVYNKSYVTLLRVLLAYGLKVFAWYSGWRIRQEGKTDCEDYALKLHEFMASVPYTPLSLTSPPPESLYPSEGEKPIPYYNLVFYLSSEVEKSMSEPQKVLGEPEVKLVGAITVYARLLKELSLRLNTNLSRHDIQAPLRNAIDVMLEYLPALGEENAARLATDKLLHTLEVKLAVNLGTMHRTTKEGEKESYRDAFARVFKAIALAVLKIHREYPSSKVRRFVEVVLDSAYERYRHLRLSQT